MLFSLKIELLRLTLHKEDSNKNGFLSHRLILIFAHFSTWKNSHAFAQQIFIELLLSVLLNQPGTDRWSSKACSCNDLVVRGEGSLPAHWALKSPTLATIMTGMCQREMIRRTCGSVLFICKMSLSERRGNTSFYLSDSMVGELHCHEESSEGKWRSDEIMRPQSLCAFFRKKGRFWGMSRERGAEARAVNWGATVGDHDGAHGRSGPF